MIILINILFCILFLASIFCGLMLIRNQWVFNRRMEMIEWVYNPPSAWISRGMPNLEDYYPSYNEMLWKFWVWKADKFLLKEKVYN